MTGPPFPGQAGKWRCSRQDGLSHIFKLARISSVSETMKPDTGHLNKFDPEPVVMRKGLDMLAGDMDVNAVQESVDEAKSTQKAEGTISLAFFGAVGQLPGLLEAEPEFIEVEMTLDTGASVHAINRLDLPGFVVVESEGSKAGQNFQAAGGKLIANEGQVLLSMVAPGSDCELTCNVQVAKVTRPIFSVTKMTESGKLSVLCKKDVAVILDEKQKVLATFHRSGGLYVATMKIRNPRFQLFTRPGR